jgi:hypothetical protein
MNEREEPRHNGTCTNWNGNGANGSPIRNYQRVLSFLQSVIFPTSAPEVIGRVFGALSLFALLQNTSKFGLSATFEIILDIYLVALRATVGLLDPVVRLIIDFVKTLYSIDIRFSEGWRHVFVILQLLFVRDAGTAFHDGRKTLAIVRLIVGIIIAFIFSILAFLSEVENALLANIIFGLVPVVGILAYDIVMYFFSSTLFFDDIGTGEVKFLDTRTKFFLGGLKRSIYRFVLVSLASLLVFLFPWVAGLEFPRGGIIAITSGLIANAIYWIWQGSLYAIIQARQGLGFKKAFLDSESGRFGMSVLGIIFWFFFFCVLNAGMRLLGF